MKIGVPREIKAGEHRVAITPNGVRELTLRGHEVLIETGAGEDSALHDDEYRHVGARIVSNAADIWESADLICKVKEPQEVEFAYFRPGQLLFTYLHLAAYPEVAVELINSRVTAIGYETVEDQGGALPLLAPMSEVAGRMAPQVGAHFLERDAGGRGVLLGGAPGVHPARVVVIGAGIVGTNAAWLAQGMEAEVILIDRDIDKLRHVDTIHRGRILTVASNQLAIERAVIAADLVIGAVLVAGARAPVLISEDLVSEMKQGAVIVDIAVDQGGIAETTHETTHADPVYEKHGVLHYGVGNMPGAVPHTSTYALTNATLEYVAAIASLGLGGALAAIPSLAAGVNVIDGSVTNRAVARALDRAFVQPEVALEGQG